MITRRQFAAALAGLTAGAAFSGARSVWAEGPPLRVAVSLDTLAGANVNDARAAYRVWGQEIASTLALRHAEMLNQVFVPSAELIQMIRAGKVDCFALTALEYSRVVDLVDPNCALIENYALNGMEYVVLVQNESPYRSLKDLRGKKLLMLHHRDTNLLRVWLGLELARMGAPDFDAFFDTPAPHDRVNEVILPVFFGRAQAAALTRRAFAMAAELNPQIGRELRPIAVSPKVIPGGFWFRKGCDPQDQQAFKNSMLCLDTIPAGRQVMALYQTTGFEQRPCSVMNGTLALIRQYERLHGRIQEAHVGGKNVGR